MSALRVYVAAPYIDASNVRIVHERLERHDIVPTSHWATVTHGPEKLEALSASAARQAGISNDIDIRNSDALLVLGRNGAGGEMFAEARIALEWGKPVVWVGRRILSAYRAGVVLAEDLDDAVRVLVDMQIAHINGARGMLLAHLARGSV